MARVRAQVSAVLASSVLCAAVAAGEGKEKNAPMSTNVSKPMHAGFPDDEARKGHEAAWPAGLEQLDKKMGSFKD